MMNDSYEHIDNKFIIELVSMCDAVNIIRYEVDANESSFTLLHTTIQSCCCKTQTYTTDGVLQSCYVVKWSHDEKMVVNVRLLKRGACKLFSPLYDQRLQQLLTQMMPDILDPINEFIGGLMILNTLKNYEPSKSYQCSPLTKSKGFTKIMYLLITLDCKKYAKRINGYIARHTKHINAQNNEGWTALHIVCGNAKNYDISTIKCILENGAIVNMQTGRGWTALMLAAQFTDNDDNIGIVKLLLEYDADVHVKSNEFVGGLMILNTLKNFEPSGSYRCSPLTESKGFTKMMYLLIMLDCKKYAERINDYIARHAKHINTQNDEGWTALHIVCRSAKNYNISTIKCMLDYGAKVNMQTGGGWTALMLAAQFTDNDDNIGIVKLLLEYGADVHVKNGGGRTAVWSSICCSNLGIAQLLLDCGADIDSVNNVNDSPLMLAANIANTENNIDALKFLLERDAKINVSNIYGLTPLSTVVNECGSHVEALSLLLKYGADPTEEKIWNWIDEEAEQIISYCSNDDLEIVKSYQMKEHTRRLLNGELRRIKCANPL